MKDFIAVISNLALGLTGWTIVFTAMALKKRGVLEKLTGFIEKIGMLIGFLLPLVLNPFVQKLFKQDPNFSLYYYEYTWVMPMAIVSPLVLLLVRLIRGIGLTNKKTKDLKKEGVGYRHQVDFEGSNDKYKVRYLGLEVFEDPETHEKVGAGSQFAGEYIEKVTMGYSFMPAQKGMFGVNCGKCRKGMKKVVETKKKVDEYSFKDMQPFKVEVEGPMIHCLRCDFDNIADYESLDEVVEGILEREKLVLL